MRGRTAARRLWRGAALAMLAVLAGCATRPGDERASLGRWLQLGPDGRLQLRAIVVGDAPCPTATVDGQLRPLSVRAGQGPQADSAAPAAPVAFAVTSCQLDLAGTVRQVRIDDQDLPLPKALSRRIVVLGDTGCRIKVAADGSGDAIQDCRQDADWPWWRIAAAAARTQPDLVIHVGDYHYREYCDNPARCAPLREQGVVVGYGWEGWNADFFAPAAPLLAAAPWVVVRGNHENCDRGGEGWLRFLSPLPYRPCDNAALRSASRSLPANNATADAYRLTLGGLPTLVVADNAAQEDYRPAGATPQDLAFYRQNLRALLDLPASEDVWLLIHKPIWYDLLDPRSPPNALQTVLQGMLPANVQFVFAGHEHAFQTINFAPHADPAYPGGRPAQIVVGNGGTQLEAFDAQSPFYEGQAGRHSKEREQPDGRLYGGVAAASGIVLNRYGFLLLERAPDDDAWTASLHDPDGHIQRQCRLDGARKAIDCTPVKR